MGVDKMKRILYVEDMYKCFEKTKSILGDSYSIDWRKDFRQGLEALSNIDKYCGGVFDVNLNYDPEKPNGEQTKEGLSLIKLVRERGGEDFPIICVSSMNNEQEALECGANLFMFKKEFWSGGKKILDNLIK